MTEPYVAVIFVLLTLVSLVTGNIISIYLWPWVKRHPRLFQFSFPPLVMSIATFTWAQANYRGIDKIPNWLRWACLQASRFTDRNSRTRYLLHDRDSRYCSSFRQVIEAGSVKTFALPPRGPNLNAYAERR